MRKFNKIICSMFLFCITIFSLSSCNGKNESKISENKREGKEVKENKTAENKKEKATESKTNVSENKDVGKNKRHDKPKSKYDEKYGLYRLRAFSLERKDGTKVQVFLYGEGKKVLLQRKISTIPYKSFPNMTKDKVKEVMESSAKDYKNLKGIKYSLEFFENSFNEEIHIMYKEIDSKKVEEAFPGLLGEKIFKDGVNLEDISGEFKGFGFEENDF